MATSYGRAISRNLRRLTTTSTASFRLRQTTLALFKDWPDTSKHLGTAAYTTTTTSPSVTSRFSYHIAASFVAKNRRFDPSAHIFHFNSNNQKQPPRYRQPSARPDSGQDAFFVSRVNDSGAVAFGVADGVGGWIEIGVDPADFAHGLCDNMAARAFEHNTTNTSCLTAQRLLQQGYDDICRRPSLVTAGGSTACVAVASPEGVLELANLGDSGFLHLRLNAVQAYTEPQTHAFNTPFQLSLVTGGEAARTAAFGGDQLHDYPRDADITQYSLRHGDVLIVATDGLLDNLFNQDVLRVVSQVMIERGAWETTKAGEMRVADSIASLTDPRAREPSAYRRVARLVSLQSLLATELVVAAKSASVNTRVNGPFAKEIHKHFPHEPWRGGKADDICAVVVVVLDREAVALRSKL